MTADSGLDIELTPGFEPQRPVDVWVVSLSADDDVPGRLGDARETADRIGGSVGVLWFDAAGTDNEAAARAWVEHGADTVLILRPSNAGQSGWIGAALQVWQDRPPRLILTPADGNGRAWSARLAARTGWTLVSPALQVQGTGTQLLAIRLDGAGRRARQVALADDRPAIVAIKPGIAPALPPDPARRGSIHRRSVQIASACGVQSREQRPADPRRADIRFVPRLIAGGRGVGGPEGFTTLRRIADKLGAGVAASRMAVDLGWIEPQRQVGQTGKTVRPDLYIACGISGASHHLEGMSESRHIVAINSDPQAPLMQMAALAIAADLHDVLREFDTLLESAV